jgi:ribonuclease HI
LVGRCSVHFPCCTPSSRRGGVEINAEHGGDRISTNNIIEITGALMALRWFADRATVEPVRIRCDSQYVVKGCNGWRHS